MNAVAEKHLAKAESYFARGDGWYAKAADEIIAAKKADPTLTDRQVGERIGHGQSWVQKVVTWRTKKSAPITPFSEPGRDSTDLRGAKRILRETSSDEIEKILDDLPDEALAKVAEAAEASRITRRIYPDKPKPSFEEAQRKAKAKDTENLKNNNWEASARLGSTIGTASAAVRMVVRQYQEFVAIVEDETFLEDGRERIVQLRTNIDLALGECLEGSIEAAFGRLLQEEAKQ